MCSHQRLNYDLSNSERNAEELKRSSRATNMGFLALKLTTKGNVIQREQINYSSGVVYSESIFPPLTSCFELFNRTSLFAIPSRISSKYPFS
jgi:hypothetical protein